MHRSPTRSILAPVFAVGIVIAGFFTGSTVADAELSTSAQRTWGVEGVMFSPSNNFDASVWALHQTGDVMYVGGKFTTITSGPGGQSVAQPALGAFEATTGDWIPGFAPDVRGGSVFAITASADGSRLFVAGDFTSIGGAPDTAGLAALNPSTGALDATWRASLERPWTADPPVGRALDIEADWLYIGGTFTHIRSGSSYQQHVRVARVSLATGAPDASFDPTFSGGGVWDIDPSPDGSRLYVAGFFTSVNGNSEQGDRFAAVQTSNGDLVDGLAPFEPNLDQTGRQYAVVATDDKVFVAGEEHMVQVLDGSTLARERVYFTGSPSFVNSWALSGGGDYQALEVVGDRVYAGCHCWSYHLEPSTGGQLFPTVSPPAGDWTPVRALVAYDAATGDHLDTVSFDLSGTSGVWAIEADDDGCIWAGGALTQSAGSWVGNIAKFCDDDQIVDFEQPSTPAGLKRESAGQNEVGLRWTSSSDNVAVAGYEIYRSTDGGFGSLVGTTSVTDPAAGTTWADTAVEPTVDYTYAIKALDEAGNRSWRSNLVTISSGGSDTERPSAPTGLNASAQAANISLNWNPSTDNFGVVGYDIHRSTNGSLGSLIGTSTTPSYTDSNADPSQTFTYAIKARDAAGNTSWRSNFSSASTTQGTDTERPAAPAGLKATIVDGDVELTWNPSSDNVAVTGYQIIEVNNNALGNTVATPSRTSATLDNLSAGSHSFTVRAIDEAGNLSWRANIVTVAIP